MDYTLLAAIVWPGSICEVFLAMKSMAVDSNLPMKFLLGLIIADWKCIIKFLNYFLVYFNLFVPISISP